MKESTSLINSNLARAAKLISSFKQVAVDQSSKEIRVYNIKQYVGEVLQSLKPKFKHNNFAVNLHCNENLTANGEAGALSQILTNLVNNTLIHGFENTTSGHIDININCEQGTVHVVYTDSGKGIAKKHMKKIFDPFFTTKRGKGGTGLGFHIVYNLVVQSLKGTIKLNDKFDQGSQFIIEFPINIHTKEKQI